MRKSWVYIKRSVVFLSITLAINLSFGILSDRASIGENELKVDSWNGFKQESFKVNGRHAIVIIPKNPRSDRAWAMRPAWFGAFANADHELLNRGFHIAFYDLSYTFASPEALKAMDDFYEFTKSKYKLNKEVSLIGMSKGGYLSLMWADKDPNKVACVYADNPVCDALSINSKEWKDGLMSEWNINSLEGFKGSPNLSYEKLAKSGTPVLMVTGAKDEIVNFEKNEKIYIEKFQKAGGNITDIIKENAKHHPHGFDDPAIVADFIENAQKND